MVTKEDCINVYIDDYLDFMIDIVSLEEFERAIKIIEKAEEEWFSDEHISDETISEWIGEKLTENEIEFEMYFKSIDWSDKNEFTTKYGSETVFKSRI